MAGPNVIKGADAKDWDYHDSHLTSLTEKNFLSSARCIIYARPSKLSAKATEVTFGRIGLIQGYNWSEQKQIDMIFEIGSDIPYLVPGRTTGQISISRIMISGADFINILYADGAADGWSDGTLPAGSKWLRSLRDVTIPIDLLFMYYDQNGNAIYSRIFQTCWINSKQESLNSGQIIVAENVSIMYEHVVAYNTTAGTSSADPVIK